MKVKLSAELTSSAYYKSSLGNINKIITKVSVYGLLGNVLYNCLAQLKKTVGNRPEHVSECRRECIKRNKFQFACVFFIFIAHTFHFAAITTRLVWTKPIFWCTTHETMFEPHAPSNYTENHSNEESKIFMLQQR